MVPMIHSYPFIFLPFLSLTVLKAVESCCMEGVWLRLSALRALNPAALECRVFHPLPSFWRRLPEPIRTGACLELSQGSAGKVICAGLSAK